MIRVVVCDDDRSFLAEARSRLQRISMERKLMFEVTTFHDSRQLVEYLITRAAPADVLLLDVEMPGLDGMEVARQIRQSRMDLVLIFLSNYDRYVFDSFPYHPFFFLRKCCVEESLDQIMQDACKELMQRNQEAILLHGEESEIVVPLAQLRYFETEDRKICLHMTDGRTLYARSTFRDLVDQLKEHGFVRAHSGGAVNLMHIVGILEGSVEMSDGSFVQVSRSQSSKLKKAMLEFWRQAQ